MNKFCGELPLIVNVCVFVCVDWDVWMGTKKRIGSVSFQTPAVCGQINCHCFFLVLFENRFTPLYYMWTSRAEMYPRVLKGKT